MSGVTLDSGALIAFDRNDRRVVGLLVRALQMKLELAVPAGVVGQVWRDGRRQVRLGRLLGSNEVQVEPLDDQRAREAGQLCGLRGTSDIIDASVALCARSRGHRVVTSDPEDMRRLDAKLELVRI